MLPVVFIGAALAGGWLASSLASSDTKEKRSSSENDPQAIASPQSYLVTPVSSSSDRGNARRISMVEAVSKFIV